MFYVETIDTNPQNEFCLYHHWNTPWLLFNGWYGVGRTFLGQCVFLFRSGYFVWFKSSVHYCFYALFVPTDSTELWHNL